MSFYYVTRVKAFRTFRRISLPFRHLLKVYTVDSRYLEVLGTLWNTSRYPYLDISDLQNWGKKINTTTAFHKWICNLTPEVKDISKILWKRGEIAPKERFLLFSTIFCYLLLDFHVKTGIRFSLRDKRFFKISGRDNESQLYINSLYRKDVIRELPRLSRLLDNVEISWECRALASVLHWHKPALVLETRL